jgi:hypothetical protein
MCSQRYYVGQQKILSIIPSPNIVAGQTKHLFSSANSEMGE